LNQQGNIPLDALLKWCSDVNCRPGAYLQNVTLFAE